MTFNVLFVDTRDVCRAPVAAAHFAHALDGPGRRDPNRPRRPRPRGTRRSARGVDVVSAGVDALPARELDPVVAGFVAELGGEPERHRAKRLSRVHVEQAHLILTAELDHRRAILGEVPGALRRTFTLREFAHLAAALPPPGSRDLADRVAEVAERRGSDSASDDLDIPDPFWVSPRAVRRCVDDIAAAVTAVTAALGLGGSGAARAALG